MIAFGTGLVGMPFLIRLLTSKGVGQPIHEDVTQHAHKAGTPVMGGLMVATGLALGFVAATLVTGAKVSRSAVLVVLVILAGAGVGAVDDFLKVRRGRNTLGLREKQKTALLVVVGLGFGIAGLARAHVCTRPSYARCSELPKLPAGLWLVFVLGVFWLTANSVNFTDGMDGLLAGCAIPPFAALSLIGFWEFRHPGIYATAGSLNIAVVAATMAAGCAGLLWWNAAPAQIFMGETGSLAIGTGMAAVALALHVELLIPILGAVFLAEGASSFLQRYWFKLTKKATGTGRRLFKMAPMHFHFEINGWPETTVVIRFWILSAVASAVALGIFYADALAALAHT